MKQLVLYDYPEGYKREMTRALEFVVDFQRMLDLAEAKGEMLYMIDYDPRDGVSIHFDPNGAEIVSAGDHENLHTAIKAELARLEKL